MSRAVGIDDATLADLPRWRDSDRFSDDERLALELAEAMTRTPVEVPDTLRDTLKERLGVGGLAELAAAVAWENHRARLNRALGVRAMGFSDGAFCVLPDPPPSSGSSGVAGG